MTNEERKIRLNVAYEIVNEVYKDVCRTHTDEISREQTYEFCCLLRDIQNIVFAEQKESVENIIDDANKRATNEINDVIQMNGVELSL